MNARVPPFNNVKVRQAVSLKTTRAMAARLTDHPWSDPGDHRPASEMMRYQYRESAAIVFDCAGKDADQAPA